MYYLFNIKLDRCNISGKPEFVRLLGMNSFEKRDATSKMGARADPVGPGTKYLSNFAFSSPFQVNSYS